MFINNLAYEASAGSGKTFMLVVRYLSLLFKGADASKILALTFTNKAANEMQERVVSTLEELENRGELDEIVKVTELSKKHILLHRKEILDNFLNANTKIMTIDKFFTQILRKFSLYASLMPDFSTFTSQHELKLFSRFLKEVSVAGKKDILITLALQSDKRLGNIFNLLNQFYEKKLELSHLTFQKVNYLDFESEAMTLINDLNSIISNCKEASKTALNGVTANSFEELQKKPWLSKDSFNYSTYKKCFNPEMDIILPKIKDSIKNYHRAKEQNFFYALSELVEIYQKSKKALYVDDSELSFSDVTSLVYEILNLINDSEFLYFRLDSQIEHMLLDEFQDTSILQYKILKPLIDEIVSGNGIFDDGSFFFVGDVKQSIYRFRGGVSALFDTVVNEQNTTVERLLTNYRSQKEVIEFVNNTFMNKIKNYVEQKVRDDANSGYVEVIQNDELIAEAITQVKKLIDIGADINDIAVLCATNGDGESLKEALIKEEIDVVTETTTKLINQKSVKAVIEYLKYLYFDENIYKYNFFALIDKKPQQIQKIDFSKNKLFDIVKKVIDRYKLFNNEFHLLRFLNVISKYDDIESLLFEYERIDTDAAASDLSGIRVLTIHKSKGLEYEHVIVIDRIKNPPPSRDTIIYEYDGINLKNVYLRITGRSALDNNYANALEKEKALVLQDNLNALYVAFTRAKQNLFIIKKSKKSSFDILDLENKKSGNLTTPNKALKQEKEFKPLKYKSLYYGTQSDILAVEKNTPEELSAINFGLCMHYMLEMLPEFQENKIPHAKNMMLNKYGYTLQDDEIQDIQNRVTMLLNSNEFLELLEGKLYREKAIRYKNNLRYIDLLIKNNSNEWIVIDYKSSTNYENEHHKQVAYYVKAIEEITNEKVDGYICYLLKDEIKIIKV